MSENVEDNIIDMSKSQLRRKAIMDGKIFDAYTDEVSDEDFAVFIKALFGPYNGPAWCPE